MNNLMRRAGIVAVLCVLLCLCLLVCSCNKKGGNDETTPAGTDPVTDPGTNPVDPPETDPVPEKVTYTVTVKNAAGEGIANVSVQLCGTTCHPGTTDASGVATFELTEATYQANINEAVAGYVVDTTAKYDFAEGETSLVITLEAEAPVVDDSVIDLKGDENVLKDYMIEGGEILYAYLYYGLNMDPESYEDLLLDVTAGDSQKFVFEATADGELYVYVEEGLGTKVSVKNVTAGVDMLPLNGQGRLEIPMTAGNTYEITVDYTKTEEVAYIVAAGVYPDGSKENPYYLGTGVVATEIVIPEGETVWCYFDDNYFFIEDAAVKVTVNGTTYAPDAWGEIDNWTVNAYGGELIGLSSSVANDKVVVYLSGSSADAPLAVVDDDFDGTVEGFEISPNAAEYVDVVYCYVPCFGANTITVSVENGEVVAGNLTGWNDDFNYELNTYAYDLDDSAKVAVVEATGYDSYYFTVSPDAAEVDVTYVMVAAGAGSDADPLVVFEGNYLISADLIDTHTLSGTHHLTGMPLDGCTIYLTYTATDFGVLTVTPSQVEGADAYSMNGVNGYNPETNEYVDMDYETGVGYIWVQPGDVIVIQIEVGSAQREADLEMSVSVVLN